MALKLFIRTDAKVIADALSLTRPVFVEKYRDTAATEQILQEAYHQLRVHHIKTTSKPMPASTPRALREALDPTIGGPDDAIVVTDDTPTPSDNKFTKMAIQSKEEAPKAEPIVKKEAPKQVEKTKSVNNEQPASSKGKKERILELLADGKKTGEVVKQLAAEGLEVSYAYVNKLSKS